jgi:uncharacterized membrane-anchored protein YhcB (DUF1043 family)
MSVAGKTYEDKKEAGTALIAMCKAMKEVNTPVAVGDYLGMKMSVTFDSFDRKFSLTLKGNMSYTVDVGSDALGNITRINNVLNGMGKQLEEVVTKLENVEHQLETAKAEIQKPFAQEGELVEKLERLAELNAMLNMDEKGDDALNVDEETSNQEQQQNSVSYADIKNSDAKASEPKVVYGDVKHHETESVKPFHDKLEVKKEQAMQTARPKVPTVKDKQNLL